MSRIKIKDLCRMAMTEDQGLLVRNAMQPAVKAKEKIILDFEGINLFATMFFNASIGYYIVNTGIKYCTNNIVLENISDLGLETYMHSFKNAQETIEVGSVPAVDNNTIVMQNIEES